MIIIRFIINVSKRYRETEVWEKTDCLIEVICSGIMLSVKTKWGMRCKSAAVLQPCGESFCCQPFTEERNGREPSRSATRFQEIPLNLLGTGGIKIRNNVASYIDHSVLIPMHGFFLKSGESLSACAFFTTQHDSIFSRIFPQTLNLPFLWTLDKPCGVR